MCKMSRTPLLILALSLVGIAIAFYDSYMVYHHQPLWCPPPISGCNDVAQSPYSRIFDLPIGYFGVVYYLDVFGLAVLIVLDRSSLVLKAALLAIAATGVIFSIYFAYLQISLIQAFCIYCLLSAVTTVALLAAAIIEMRSTEGGRFCCWPICSPNP
ncbi:MAG: vitamin K epoxide reductase family protein [Xanthobacteraceae bacterium]|nr:vitamin K epoxide reductase family protein [Xanthobacteraceae bacterium]